jgi:ankyrin repeat protein
MSKKFRLRHIALLVFAAWLGSLYYNRFYAVSNIASGSGRAHSVGGIGQIGVASKFSHPSSPGRSNPSGIDKNAIALMDAAAKGDAEEVKANIAKTKVDTRDSERRTALMYASWNGHNEICNLLLAAGANATASDINDHTALDYAAGRGLVETVEFLTPRINMKDEGRTLEYAKIIRAAYADDIALLPANKNPVAIDRLSTENASALHIAANSGSTTMAEALIKRGASVNLANSNKQTPLHWAAWNNQPEMVELLVNKGARLAAQDSMGNTPLMMAALNHSTAAVQKLLAKGARKDAINNEGKMAIILAQEKGYADIVNILQ